jgi:hypothetical protein
LFTKNAEPLAPFLEAFDSSAPGDLSRALSAFTNSTANFSPSLIICS